MHENEYLAGTTNRSALLPCVLLIHFGKSMGRKSRFGTAPSTAGAESPYFGLLRIVPYGSSRIL